MSAVVERGGASGAPAGAPAAPGEAAFPTPEDAHWARKVLELQRDRLTPVRATAENWRGGLAGLAALVTGGWALAAPFLSDEISAPATRVLVGVCAAASTLAFVAAAWCAMRASFGFPARIVNTGDALRDWTEAEADRAVALLRAARWLTVAGLVAVFLASASMYVASAPPEDDPPAPTLVRVAGGESYCGVTRWAEDGSALLVVAPDGTTREVPTGELAAVVPEGCPG